MYDATAAALTATLLESAHPDGGWAYVRGNAPRLEPTVWALAALAASPHLPRPFEELAEPHRGYLARAQRPDGLLVDAYGMPPAIATNGLVACVLPALAPAFASAHGRLLAALADVKGIKFGTAPGEPQDNSLQAWPWYEGTFSWVEPTAWCTLALKRAAPSVRREGTAARVSEAEALLRNRQCTTGGWNYGNGTMLGQDLRPYVPTTAITLLALQDTLPQPDTLRALDWLVSARLSEPSTMARSLAALALRLYGRGVSDVLDALADGVPRTTMRGNLHHLALALYALTLDVHDGGLFRV